MAAFEISFSPQVWHVPSPPSLYSPSLHWRHSVSPPSEHGDIYPSPIAHDEHGIQADWDSFGFSLTPHALHGLSPPTLTEFTAQVSQAVSLSPATQADTNPSPTLHTLHGMQADCNSFGLSFRPHTLHVDASPVLMEFTGQSRHSDDVPPGDIWPAGHGEQPPPVFKRLPLEHGAIMGIDTTDPPPNCSLYGDTRKRCS